jgi:hypothetical protein
VRKSHGAEINALTKERTSTKEESITKETTTGQCVDFEALSSRATKLGVIATLVTLQEWVKQYGLGKVSDKLNILEKSTGVTSPVAWLLCALKNDYKAPRATVEYTKPNEPTRATLTAEETLDLINKTFAHTRSDKSTALAALKHARRAIYGGDETRAT